MKHWLIQGFWRKDLEPKPKRPPTARLQRLARDGDQPDEEQAEDNLFSVAEGAGEAAKTGESETEG